jgi:hypothetical protein
LTTLHAWVSHCHDTVNFPEPFIFADEAILEAGFSWERYALGADMQPILDPDSLWPLQPLKT